jgi:hypothetical protein
MLTRFAIRVASVLFAMWLCPVFGLETSFALLLEFACIKF